MFLKLLNACFKHFYLEMNIYLQMKGSLSSLYEVNKYKVYYLRQQGYNLKGVTAKGKGLKKEQKK